MVGKKKKINGFKDLIYMVGIKCFVCKSNTGKY